MLINGFRLNVGQVEALSCTFQKVESVREFGCYIEFRILLAGDDCDLVINLNPEFVAMVTMNYASIGQGHWCYSFMFYTLPWTSLESIYLKVFTSLDSAQSLIGAIGIHVREVAHGCNKARIKMPKPT